MDKNIPQVKSQAKTRRRGCVRRYDIEISKREAIPTGFTIKQSLRADLERITPRTKAFIATISLAIGLYFSYVSSIESYTNLQNFFIPRYLSFLFLVNGFYVCHPFLQKLSTKQFGLSLILVFTIFGFLVHFTNS